MHFLSPLRALLTSFHSAAPPSSTAPTLDAAFCTQWLLIFTSHTNPTQHSLAERAGNFLKIHEKGKKKTKKKKKRKRKTNPTTAEHKAELREADSIGAESVWW